MLAHISCDICRDLPLHAAREQLAHRKIPIWRNLPGLLPKPKLRRSCFASSLDTWNHIMNCSKKWHDWTFQKIVVA